MGLAVRRIGEECRAGQRANTRGKLGLEAEPVVTLRSEYSLRVARGLITTAGTGVSA